MSEFEIRAAWKQEDAAIEQDAVDFWQNVVKLPANADPKDRAKELVAAAYTEGSMAGLSTAQVVIMEETRHKFALYRIAVAPKFRQAELMRTLVRATYSVLEKWSLANRDRELSGIAAVFQAPELQQVRRPPVTEAPHLMLVAYNDRDEQLRIRWFDHVRV